MYKAASASRTIQTLANGLKHHIPSRRRFQGSHYPTWRLFVSLRGSFLWRDASMYAASRKTKDTVRRCCKFPIDDASSREINASIATAAVSYTC
jgi:hypothetical protein